jgi:AmmeMemoRadiSam system protein B/AmmeMemoRadiSam system protein A
MILMSNTQIRRLCLIMVLICGAFLSYGQGTESTVNRAPAFAGSFYPAGRDALSSNLDQLFSQASPMEFEGTIQSLIVPHAGYTYSGIVAASAYKSIPTDAAYKNIFIIASSHREQFAGASVYNVGNYMTPLGEVEVNRELGLALAAQNKTISYQPKAHDREHSIEVQLPFLQYHFKDLPPIVPIVMGSSTVAAARDLAAALHPYFTPENLFIISSDFSHYPAYQDAVRIDRLTAEAIEKKDPENFYNTLRKNSREAVPNLVTSTCGWSSILTMLYMADARENLKVTPILYRNSGDSREGDRERVVGYWAIAGHVVDPDPGAFLLGADDKKALLELSRTTLQTYVEEGRIYQPVLQALPTALKRPAGAFVSLYTGKRLRGCIGNFNPDEPLYFVVQEMTIAAASRDPRFAPVEAPELEYIHIEISVLTPLHKINSIDEFQLGKHGIYISKDGKSGTYLPQVAEDTGWSKEEFLGHCSREKAGLGWDGWKSADLYTYEAIVFREENKE